jgi:hypothetical protein
MPLEKPTVTARIGESAGAKRKLVCSSHDRQATENGKTGESQRRKVMGLTLLRK